MEEEEEDELAQSTASVSRPAPAYGELRASVQIEAPSVVAPVRAIQGSVASVAHRHASSPVEVRSPPLQSSHRHADFARGRTVRVVIESTWGGGDFCGLTGVQVLLGRELRPAVVHRGSVVGSPHGLADIGYEDDARTPDKLVDGVNNTTSEDHMWLFPFTMGGEHSLVLTLAEESDVYGLRVWNYNRGQEAARTRGARQVRVLVDGLDVCEAELRMVCASSVPVPLLMSRVGSWLRRHRLRSDLVVRVCRRGRGGATVGGGATVHLPSLAPELRDAHASLGHALVLRLPHQLHGPLLRGHGLARAARRQGQTHRRLVRSDGGLPPAFDH